MQADHGDDQGRSEGGPGLPSRRRKLIQTRQENGTDPAWAVLFGAWSVQGAIALWVSIALPSDPSGAVLFGYSAARLAMIAVLLVWVILSAAFAQSAWRTRARPAVRPQWWWKTDYEPERSWKSALVLVLALLIPLASQAVLAVLRGLSQHGLQYHYAAVAIRLAPILDLLTLAGLEYIALTAYLDRSWIWGFRAQTRVLLGRAGTIWAILVALTVLVAATGLGIVPDHTGDWGLPAVALLEWQIVLACGLYVGLRLIEIFRLEGRYGPMFPRKAEPARPGYVPRREEKHIIWKPGPWIFRNLNSWLPIAIYVGTLALWLSQPVNPAFSATRPRPPNFEVYPLFDAQVYDEHAQSILIGNGMQETEIPSRPLYVVFLALLHLIVGQDYDLVIAAQSLVLAFFPLVLYWFGTEFYGRGVGVAMAVLAALRDYTSNIAAPFTYALTYSKLYLSELPVAIPIVLFLLLLMRAARADYPARSVFVAGGILGIAIMIRTQAVVALPVVLLVGWLGYRKQWRRIVRNGVLMSAAIALVVSPWIWRNWKNTGQFVFDSPQTQTINLALRYNALNGVEVDAVRGPDESSAEYNARLMRLFFEAVRLNPAGSAQVLANRFFNNLVANVLLFPLRDDLVNLDELWQPSRAFWEDWRGTPTTSQVVVILFYLGLLSLGIAATRKRLGLWGFAPLGVNVLYHLWTSIALLSGQRFLVTMDWSIYMYYMIGLAVLIDAFLGLVAHVQPTNPSRSYRIWLVESFGVERQKSLWKRIWTHPARPLVAAGCAFLLVGASIPLSEVIFPKRYPPTTQQALIEQVAASPALKEAKLDAACVQAAIRDNGLAASNGMALSPRWYDVGEGEATAKLGFAESDEARLVFLITGNRYGLILIHLDEAPDFFPHAADVVVFTDPETSHKAWFVAVRKDGTERMYVSDEIPTADRCRGSP